MYEKYRNYRMKKIMKEKIKKLTSPIRLVFVKLIETEIIFKKTKK